MDFITGLPLPMGSTVTLVIVDRFSKAAHLEPFPLIFQLLRLRNYSQQQFANFTGHLGA